MAPNPRHKRAATRLDAHPTLGTAGNDNWQRQADAAAWSAVSGMHPSLYLGGIEPIPIPPDLRAQLREAGKAMAGDPSAARADALLRLAHRAVYGAEMPGALFQPDPAPAGGVSGGDWWETPAEPEKPSGAALEAFALASFAALQAAEPDPEGAGEAPATATAGDWWE
jgi:hypothetical protein